ncbi:CUB and sushi domain-containing protein 2 [Holothuria leucospilota]|uniref:CUB and sushi domain-containing protein 2 n=1 Tax=Holothuria leucospilota TaxID=206669 RepID=A0A9Q1BDE9_HOLLE|nr:CUB and sushi domain-containing protein 2 [Holothuria leucospilota]
MASNAGYETNGDIESPNAAGNNEGYDNHSAQHARNQTKEVLELNYRNSKHSAICSIVVFLALILLLGAILFVLIFFLDGPGSSQPEIEMQVEVKGQYVVAVSITIQNLDFKESLSDRTSKEYTDLEDEVTSAVSSAIAGTELKDKYADLEINNVRSGSVIVDFVVVFCDPLMTESDIIQTVQDALETINSNSAIKSNLKIDNSQLSVEAASGDDLDKLKGTFCEPSMPTISPTGTTPVTPTAGVSRTVFPTPTSSQLIPTLSSEVITPTPSLPTATPTATTTPSSSFITTEVPGTSSSVSLSTTKVSSMTTLMSSTVIKTSGFTTTQSPTTTLPSTSIQIVTTPLTTSFVTSTTSLSPTITPSLPTSVTISSTPSISLTSTSSIIVSTTMPVSVFPTPSTSHDVSMTSSLSISLQPSTSMPLESSFPVTTSAMKPTTISPTPTMTSLPITADQSSFPPLLPSVTVTTMSSMSVESLSMTPGPTPSQTTSSMRSATISQASPSVTPSSTPSASSTLISPTSTIMPTPSPTATTMVIQPTSSLITSSSVLIPSLSTSSISSSVSSSLSQTSASVASLTTSPLVPSFSSPFVTPSPTSASPATSRSTFFSREMSILPHTSTSVILPTPLPSTTIQTMVTTMTTTTTETTAVTSSPPMSSPVGTTSTPTEPSSLSPSVTAYQSSSEEPVTRPEQTTTTVPVMTSLEVYTTQTPSTSASSPVYTTSAPTEPGSLSPSVSTYQSSSEEPITSPVQSTTTVRFMTSSEVPTTQTPSTSPSPTTAGLSTEEVSTQVAPPATLPLTVCSESSRFFNPSIFLNSTDVLDGTALNFQCSWNYIVAIPGGRIRVQFLTFDIGNDVLEIDLSDSRTVTYSGSNIPPELTTDAHMVRFTLKTDLQTNLIKFSIFLQMILPENSVTAPMLNASTAVAGPTTLPGCSSSAQLLGPGPPKTITSPGYPRGYLTDLTCTWQFISTGANQEGILLEFVGFDLGDDILEVSSSDANFVSRQLTGSQLPPPISTSAGQLQLRFISDGADTAMGFEVTIRVIEPNAPCVPSHMFVNSDQSRVVTSPGYPINYGPNLVCSWTLQSTQPNSQIIITFLNFDLVDDLLQVIYQGNILQFSGSLLPTPITVSSDRVELQFTSNGENQSLGFRLEVSVQVPIMTTPGTTQVMTSAPQQNILSTVPDLSCTQSSVLLTAASDPKTFTSPGYPTHNYGHQEPRCIWSFVLVDNTKLLRLQFVSFDVGNDVVSVDYGASISKMLTGSNLPDDITTVGNTLSVALSTSPQSNYPGFEAFVTVVDR